MKYTMEWKKKTKKWVQKHKHSNGKTYWAIHYMQNDIEYSNGEYSTEKEAKGYLSDYNV